MGTNAAAVSHNARNTFLNEGDADATIDKMLAGQYSDD